MTRTISLRPALMAFLGAGVLIQLVAFLPNRLETPSQSIPESALIEDPTRPILATAIPKNLVPSYSADDWTFVSVREGVKEWLIRADRAYVYTDQNVIHAVGVHTEIFDADGKITKIDSLEGQYFTNSKSLEAFGNVVATFPDGFQILSEYMKYDSVPSRFITVPASHLVVGQGKDPANLMHFQGMGMTYDMNGEIATLLTQARVTSTENKTNGRATEVTSDTARVMRKDQKIFFELFEENSKKPNSWVKIQQPDLVTRSRLAELRYGDGPQKIQGMIAEKEVTIQEIDPETLAPTRYSTSGRAIFESADDTIKLKEFPQVYQGNDTIVGDTVIVHRGKDLVEVENSNAFSEGQPLAPAGPKSKN
jgi:LPS export ABC transporter protein LptC